MRDVTNTNDAYTPEELSGLVDFLMENVCMMDGLGFLQFRIRGIYVSHEVIKQALAERLEKMAGSAKVSK